MKKVVYVVEYNNGGEYEDEEIVLSNKAHTTMGGACEELFNADYHVVLEEGKYLSAKIKATKYRKAPFAIVKELEVIK